MSTITTALAQPAEGELHRNIDWRGAFWVASGVPALVLFSIGGIAGTTGTLAFAIWTASMIMGFLQSFTYAEIAGLFPNKSGGASVYGATAWLRYSKFIAPLSVWCNWFAWSPVLSLGCSIAAAYILNALAPVPLFTETSPEVRRLYRGRMPGRVPPTPSLRWPRPQHRRSAAGRCSATRSGRSPSRSTPPSSSARC